MSERFDSCLDTETARLFASLAHSISYADALTAAVRRHGDFWVDALCFAPAGELPTDHIATGHHTLLFRLIGTQKTYRVMIGPVPETHR